MSTITQLKKRIHIKKKQCLVKALKKCPQKKGICTKILIHTPKKPSSAKRKLMRVRLSSKKFVFAYIPGEGVQTLRAFSRVLVRGGSRPDLPGVHYIIIRGKLDLSFLDLRRQGRSKYGMKAIFRPRKKDRYNAFNFLTEKKKTELSTLFLKNSNFLKNKIKKNIYLRKLKKKILYCPFLLRQKRNTSFMFFNFFFQNFDHYPDSLFYFKKKIKKLKQRYFFLYQLRAHKKKIKQKRVKKKRNIAQ